MDIVTIGDDGVVLVMRGLGTGRFARCVPESGGGQAGSYRMRVTDVTGDGRPDVVAYDGRGIEVRVNTGTGFGAAVQMPDSEGDEITVADADGDGRVDLLHAEEFLRGHGDGTFDRPAVLPGRVDAAADLNGDGVAEAVIELDPGSERPRLAVLDVRSGAITRLARPHARAYDFPAASIRDDDGDGRRDVVAKGDRTDFVWRGDWRGGFAAPVSHRAAGRGSIERDLDGDGDRDGVTIRGDRLHVNDFACVLLGYGRSFVLAKDSSNGLQLIGIRDLDGDGHPDVVLARSGEIVTYLGGRPAPRLDTPVRLGASLQVAAYGRLVAALRSNYPHDVTLRYRLGRHVHSVRPRGGVLGLSAGPDGQGRPMLVLDLCHRVTGCAPWQLDPRSGRWRRIRIALPTGCTAQAPSLWRGRLAFGVVGRHCRRPGVWVRRGHARPRRVLTGRGMEVTLQSDRGIFAAASFFGTFLAPGRPPRAVEAGGDATLALRAATLYIGESADCDGTSDCYEGDFARQRLPAGSSHLLPDPDGVAAPTSFAFDRCGLVYRDASVLHRGLLRDDAPPYAVRPARRCRARP